MVIEWKFTKMKQEECCCVSCGEAITERYVLQVNSQSWHSSCLRCCICDGTLDHQPSCFIKDDNIYCKADYTRQFGARCAKCSRGITALDWVRRAKEHVYHLACFACDACKRQLSTGEEFALLDQRVLCKTHYLEVMEGGSTSNEEGGEGDSHHKAKTKRVRTTFTEEQLQVLQANFDIDSNPDGQDLERIAQITGLSKRVTQVWFQNSRARQKKHQNQHGRGRSRNSDGEYHVETTRAPYHPLPVFTDTMKSISDSAAQDAWLTQSQINLHFTYSLQQDPTSLDSLSESGPPSSSPMSCVSGEV